MRLLRHLPTVTLPLFLAACAGTGEFTTTLLHFNDGHSHLPAETIILKAGGIDTRAGIGGVARLGAQAAVRRAATPNPLLLHAGDALQGTLYYTLFKGDADAAMLDAIDVDAMAIGNHEFDDGDANLAHFAEQLNFPLLASNMDVPAGDPLDGKYLPWQIKKVSGEHLAIVGLANPDTANISSPGAGVVFSEPVARLKALIPRLEARGINKVVVLSHLGYESDLALARAVAGIDVIVGGHSHTLLGDYSTLGLKSSGSYPTVVTGPDGKHTCVVQAWSDFRALGELSVNFAADGSVKNCHGQAWLVLGAPFQQRDTNGRWTDVDAEKQEEIARNLTTGGNVAVLDEDPTLAAKLADWSGQVDARKEMVVGKASAKIPHIRVPGVDSEGVALPQGSLIAPLVAQAFLDQVAQKNYQPDLAILNAGAVRTSLPAGDISIGTAYTLLPFSDTLVTLDLFGSEIKQVLEDALSNIIDKGNSTGAFPYAADLRYAVAAGNPANHRIYWLEARDRNGGSWQPLQPARRYRVVTVNYLAAGKDGYTTFKSIQDTRGPASETYLDSTQAFVDYVKAAGNVLPPAPSLLAYTKGKADPDRIMNWAEATWPEIFLPSADQTSYHYRCYATGVCLGFTPDGKIWSAKPGEGIGATDLGPMRPWLDQAEAAGY